MTSKFTAIAIAFVVAGLATAQDGELIVVEPTDIQDLPGHQRGARTPPAEPEAPETERTPVREWFGGSPLFEWSRLTGDWGGFRTDLESRGVTFGSSYTVDLIDVTHPGADSGFAHTAIFDANVTFDLETMFGWAGTSVYVDFYSTHQDWDEASVGDYQGVSLIDTGGSRDQIAELWMETWFADELLRLKAGKIDANAEFAFVEAGGDFMHTSGVWSPVQFAMPTYPDPATGVVLFAYPTDQLSIGVGFFDGATAVDGVRTGARGPSTFFDDELSDDYWLIGELGYAWTLANDHAGRAAAGLWWHTGDFATWDAGTDDGTLGWYAIVEQRLWAAGGADADHGIFGFVHVEGADQDVAEIELNVAAGATWRGPCSSRPDDSFGLLMSWVDLVDDAGYEDDETAFELTYRFQATPAIAVSPSLHYIVNPGGDPALDDAFVTALRLEFSF